MRQRRRHLKDLPVAEREQIVSQVEVDLRAQVDVAREHRVST